MPAKLQLEPAAKPAAIARKRSWTGVAVIASLGIHGLALAAFVFWPKWKIAGDPNAQRGPLAIALPQQLPDSENSNSEPAPEPAPRPKPQPRREKSPSTPPEPEVIEVQSMEFVMVSPPEPRLLFKPATDFLDRSVEFPEPPQPEADPEPKPEPNTNSTSKPPEPPPSSTKKPPTAPKGALAIAKPKWTPKPAYPSSALKAKIEGTVVLNLSIDVKGKVVDAKITRSSGVASLDEAALRGVRKWKFTPAKRGGVATPSIVRAPIAFQLQN